MSNKSTEEVKEVPKENEFKFGDSKGFPEEIRKKLENVLQEYSGNIEPTKLSSKLKNILDKDFGSGWCVVVGGHFSGAFTFMENYYLEISCRDIVIVIFKTYKPKN